MAKTPAFDVAAAHKHFAAECFNTTWDLIDKTARTPEEDEQMLLLSMASAWHWTQRADCTAENMSIAYWQISRVYALLGQADNARRFGQQALQAGKKEGVPPFCEGYAYEALARAEMAAGNRARMAEYLAEARRVSETMKDAETKKALLADLDTIK